jgi:hypothetical protein
LRISLYADDVAVFIHPSEHDLLVTDYILNIFAEASGLKTNMDKTQYYPIRCDEQSRLSVSCWKSYFIIPLHLSGAASELQKTTKSHDATSGSKNCQKIARLNEKFPIIFRKGCPSQDCP